MKKKKSQSGFDDLEKQIKEHLADAKTNDASSDKTYLDSGEAGRIKN